MGADFRLLGAIEMFVDGSFVEVGHHRQRCVLAVMLVEANRPVPVAHVVDRVWGGGQLPAHPASAVGTYVSLLRRVLEPARQGGIARRSAGYVLEVDEENVDLHRFCRLIERAGAIADGGDGALLEQALGLWRGEPFAGADTPWFNTIRTMLAHKRQEARLDLTDIRLRQGRHAAVLAGLRDQVDEQPLDERLAGQFMLAHYRCGRTADALDCYQRLRRRLGEELGADPGPELRALHRRILTADPALAAPPHPVRISPVPRARQLPLMPWPFAGRADELARLTAMHDNASRRGHGSVLAITGTGGIGKTWLALRWAYRHLDRFPDGQLYVNLRGFDPTGKPMAPATAIRGFLDALGGDSLAVPADFDAQAGLFRSMVAGKRMLVMLDNAADSDQVRSLLPGDSRCTVLVTSRGQLSTLAATHGGLVLDLDPLNADEARELLVRHLSAEKLAAEPRAATEILELCAGLPLAIGIVAARAAQHRDFPLAALAAELRDPASRLDLLDGGDLTLNLRAVLSWSCRGLSRDATSAAGLVGSAPGPDLSLPAAAALTGLPTARARIVLRELEDAHLVQQHAPHRFCMHDLVRLFAAQHMKQTDADDRAAEPVRRLVDFYLHTAFAANRRLDPHYPPIRLDAVAAGCQPLCPDDESAALAWFAAEHSNLLVAQRLAADRGWRAEVWQLAWTLGTYHRRSGLLSDNLTVWSAALDAAHRAGDRAAHTLTHRLLGYAYARAGHADDAQKHLRRALSLAEAADDRLGQAHAYHLMAGAWEQQANDRQALRCARHALPLFRALDLPVWEGWTLGQIGWHQARLGDHDEGRAHCAAALALARRHDDPEGEAVVLDSLGYICVRAADYARATHYYEQALTAFNGLGNASEEADTLVNLGAAHYAQGQREQARSRWEAALEHYRTQRRPGDAERVSLLLDRLGQD
ncbi:BTAD domain-containing putative transcriptional regulator [Amycolatopsis halotolerans]|uniref:BTAD domain-containing putative transcriptional regulator n=1 Tax=Amycolatopsis halotolerans TaxID=330083 RepID=A0ABV7QPT8_9PSEU